jgi:hypothetical protein
MTCHLSADKALTNSAVQAENEIQRVRPKLRDGNNLRNPGRI